MFSNTHREKQRPKSREAIDNAIFNNGEQTIEILKFKYREIFGLTSKEMLEEPTDEFFTNLYIYGQIKKKEDIEAKHG